MNKLSILIVEDEAIIAEDLASKLRQLGYDVAGKTATGEEAIELARQQQPSLVLMDVHLAGAMDGVKTAQVIYRESHIPVLFLTANSDMNTVGRAQQADAFGYLLKPFKARDLRIQIEMALYKHNVEQQLREREERLAGINQILQTALTCESEEDLGRACLNVAEKITQSKFGFIGEVNKAGLEDIAISDPGWDSCKILDPSGHHQSPGNFKIHGIYGRVLLDGKGLFTNDPAHHPDSIGLPKKHPPLTSFLGVPLMRAGSVIGLLAVGNREGGYSQKEQDALEALTPSIVEAFMRKRAEDALKKSEGLLGLLIEQAPAGLAMFDTEMRYLKVSRRWRSDYNLGSRDLLGKSHYDIFPEISKEWREISQRCLAGETLRSDVDRFVRADGSTQWIRWEIQPWFDAAGKIGGIVIFTEEITDLINAEEAVQRYDLLAQHSRDIILFLRRDDGRIMEANSAASKAYGYDHEELLRLTIKDLRAPEALMLTEEQMAEADAKGIVFETIHCDKEGRHFHVEVSSQGANIGGKRMLISIIRDITERKLVEEALRKSKEQLLDMNNELERRVQQRTRELQETQKRYLHAEKLSAIGKLSASIAHEFNNPLQGILSVLKGFKRRAALEEEDMELLEEAIVEGDRVKDLIRSLQDFNRPSSDKYRPMDVHKSLDSVLLLHKSDFNGKRISVVLNYAERLPQIYAVADQIKQVFLNMLTNAGDACHQPGGVITVSTWQEGEDKVAVAIKDTGIGIKPSDMELIFQPFYTTKAEVKGTGLGLSVSYGIIKNHQGEIRVESQPGQGTTFTILLPIKGSEVDSSAKDSSHFSSIEPTR